MQEGAGDKLRLHKAEFPEINCNKVKYLNYRTRDKISDANTKDGSHYRNSWQLKLQKIGSYFWIGTVKFTNNKYFWISWILCIVKILFVLKY